MAEQVEQVPINGSARVCFRRCRRVPPVLDVGQEREDGYQERARNLPVILQAKLDESVDLGHGRFELLQRALTRLPLGVAVLPLANHLRHQRAKQLEGCISHIPVGGLDLLQAQTGDLVKVRQHVLRKRRVID